MRSGIPAILNVLKAWLLLVGACGVLGGIGFAAAGYRGLSILVFCVLMLAGAAYWYGDRIVLGMVGARELPLGEAPRRPVRLGGVAAARAVERGDVLERDEDVAVQLDVRDVLDVAVGREHAFLVLAAEEGDLDLLALVLVRVVLHRWVSLAA